MNFTDKRITELEDKVAKLEELMGVWAESDAPEWTDRIKRLERLYEVMSE